MLNISNESPNTQKLIHEFDLYLEILVRCIPEEYKVKDEFRNTGFDYVATIDNYQVNGGSIKIQREYDNLNSCYGGGKRNSIWYENDKFKLEFAHKHRGHDSKDKIDIIKKIKNSSIISKCIIQTDGHKTEIDKSSNGYLLEEAYLIVIDLLEEVIRGGKVDIESINFWKDNLKKNPVLRKALEDYLNTTPLGKYSGLVQNVLKKSCINNEKFIELMKILTKKKRLNYGGIEFVYDKKIDYSDETGEFTLEIDPYRCALFSNGIEIAETDSYDRSEGNVRLLYEIVKKVNNKGLLVKMGKGNK